jgi:hypothetical protein
LVINYPKNTLHISVLNHALVNALLLEAFQRLLHILAASTDNQIDIKPTCTYTKECRGEWPVPFVRIQQVPDSSIELTTGFPMIFTAFLSSFKHIRM